MGYLLMDYVLRKMNYTRIGIIRASNRYGRFGVREINDSARRMQHPVLIEMAYRPGSTDFSLQLERMKVANLDAVIHWGDAPKGPRASTRCGTRGQDGKAAGRETSQG